MRPTLDLTPYRRATVGFDRLFDLLEADLKSGAPDGYPPFDIVRLGEDRYSIRVAVTGFRPDEIEVVAEPNQLVIRGKVDDKAEAAEYLHRGIAIRPFERRFQLADYVDAEAGHIENGLLSIDLRRIVPEAMKPRRITIQAPSCGTPESHGIEDKSSGKAA